MADILGYKIAWVFFFFLQSNVKLKDFNNLMKLEGYLTFSARFLETGRLLWVSPKSLAH